MSFSKELKEEISKIVNLSNKEAVKYELIGYLISSNISIQSKKIKFRHPKSEKEMELEAKLPEYFQEILDNLK